MAYMVIHLEKFHRPQLKGIRMHNERLTKNHSNKDINVSRTHLNYSLIDRPTHMIRENGETREVKDSYAKAVTKKLAKGTKVRKNAVMDAETVFSSSKEFMDSLTPDQQRDYFQTCVDYMGKKVGKDNLLYAEVHLDEKTPHLHMGFAPIDPKTHTLNAKKMIGRDFLTELQDELPAVMKAKGFDIQRGKKDSKRKHVTKEAHEQAEKEAKGVMIKDITERVSDKISLNPKTKLNPSDKPSPKLKTPDGQIWLQKQALEVLQLIQRALVERTNKRQKKRGKELAAKAQKQASKQIELDKQKTDQDTKQTKLDERETAVTQREQNASDAEDKLKQAKELKEQADTEAEANKTDYDKLTKLYTANAEMVNKWYPKMKSIQDNVVHDQMAENLKAEKPMVYDRMYKDAFQQHFYHDEWAKKHMFDDEYKNREPEIHVYNHSKDKDKENDIQPDM